MPGPRVGPGPWARAQDINSVYTDDISSVYKEDKSCIYTEDISSVYTEDISESCPKSVPTISQILRKIGPRVQGRPPRRDIQLLP